MSKDANKDKQQIAELVKERQKLELRLRESENNYRTLLDHLPVFKLPNEHVGECRRDGGRFTVGLHRNESRPSGDGPDMNGTAIV
ncbi:MAG: hypothetical protein ACERK6_12825, partial [Candidatus Aminicenantaceae bacterium]